MCVWKQAHKRTCMLTIISLPIYGTKYDYRYDPSRAIHLSSLYSCVVFFISCRLKSFLRASERWRMLLWWWPADTSKSSSCICDNKSPLHIWWTPGGTSIEHLHWRILWSPVRLCGSMTGTPPPYQLPRPYSYRTICSLIFATTDPVCFECCWIWVISCSIKRCMM